MTRAKKSLALVLVVGALLTLWALGPAPLRTCPYIQQVTPTSAVIARIDASPKRVRVRVTSGSPHGREEPRVFSEDAPTREHAVPVTGLSPLTRYRFQIEETDASGRIIAADRGEFRTSGDDDRILVRFAAVGDTGYLPWWICFEDVGWLRARPLFALLDSLGPQWDVAKWMSRQETKAIPPSTTLDFFLHLGDVIYPKGEEKHYSEGFFLPFEPVLRRTPLFAALGNHDAEHDRGATFLRVFHLPTNTATGEERFYTFTWGPLRVVVLDTTTSETAPGSPMAQWLDATLAANVKPWVVVAQHHTVFSASEDGDDPKLVADLWPAFARLGVDLVLTGHAHNYQRYQPVDGVVQVTEGGGGKSLYELRSDPRLRASAAAYGFLVVEVQGGKLSGEAWGRHGESIDRFALDRAEELRQGEWSLRRGCARCEKLAELLQLEPKDGVTCRHGTH